MVYFDALSTSEAKVYFWGTGLFLRHWFIFEDQLYFFGPVYFSRTDLFLKLRPTSEAEIYFWGTGLFLRHWFISETQICFLGPIYFWDMGQFLRYNPFLKHSLFSEDQILPAFMQLFWNFAQSCVGAARWAVTTSPCIRPGIVRWVLGKHSIIKNLCNIHQLASDITN